MWWLWCSADVLVVLYFWCGGGGAFVENRDGGDGGVVMFWWCWCSGDVVLVV